MADETLFKGAGTKTNDGYTAVKESYQPQPEKLEKGYQPVKQENRPATNLKAPTFETGIQSPAQPIVTNVPVKSHDDK